MFRTLEKAHPAKKILLVRCVRCLAGSGSPAASFSTISRSPVMSNRLLLIPIDLIGGVDRVGLDCWALALCTQLPGLLGFG
jgi:hypothetical protein